MPYCMGKKHLGHLWHSALPGVMVSFVLMYCNAAGAQGLPRFDMSLGADYRHARLDWNIAGSLTGTTPNVLSELTWRDLEIAQVSGTAQMNIGDHVVLRGAGTYGEIQGGDNQDSDYLGENRTLEFSRSNNGTGGSISDTAIGIGYRVRVLDHIVMNYANFTPMVGYSRHLQNLKIKDGVQTIPATGPFPDLNSSYDAEWKGPWLGLNLRLEASERIAMLLDFQYHWIDYVGKANWNLSTNREHPVSFRHDANGNGFIAGFAVSYTLNKNWGILARLESQHWETDPGIDTDYQINTVTGEVQPIFTRLNAVHWKSSMAGIAATFLF